MKSHVYPIALTMTIGILVCAPTAQADTTYTYTGNNFDTVVGGTYTTSMSVSGSFTLSAPLPRNMPLTDIRHLELSYTFTDEIQIRTDSDSYVTEFEVSTDASGQISDWNIHIVELPVATTVGDVRDLIETHSWTPVELDRGGEAHCDVVTAGECSQFVMDDWGEVFDNPGSWTRTGDVPPAQATYSYDGNNFDVILGGTYSTANRVTGEFTLATPLAPNLPKTDVSEAVVSYSFADGVHTRTADDSYIFLLEVGTDGAGFIDEWSIFIVEGPPPTAVGEVRQYIETYDHPGLERDRAAIGECSNITNGVCDQFTSNDFGEINDEPGDWDRPPSSSATADYSFDGNNYTYIEGPSYDMTMFLSGDFSTADPLPASMALTDITHTVTSFSFFDGVATRTLEDSWGWRFRVETDAHGDISRWNLHLQEEPEATSIGERRHLVDSFSYWIQGIGVYSLDQAGYGDCTEVTNGTCTTFILDDYGSNQFEPGSWTTTVTAPPATNPIPTMGVWGATLLVLILAALGVVRLWRT